VRELRQTALVFRRELASYFATPLAYIFIVIFLLLAGSLTFFVGGILGRDQADLVAFFAFHPWLYLFLVPALSMRLWAEERRLGTAEMLLTLPLPISAAVLGKFLAAWAFTAIALALTFPMWLTVAYLGNPDHGVVVASYLGSLLMAGSYLAIGSMISAATKNQVIAFVVTAAVCLILTLAGASAVLDFVAGWASPELVSAVAGFGFMSHFEAIQRGVIDARDAVYFLSTIAVALAATVVVIDWKKAE
jgi:ABC-2 type transport system permease protein